MKLFTFIGVLLISIVSVAGQQGELNIFSNTGEPFYVTVDGNYQNYQPASNVNMQVWGNNMHNLRIYSANNLFTLDQRVSIQPNHRVTYRIDRYYGHYTLVLLSDVPLYGNAYGQNQSANCHPNSHPHQGYPGQNYPGNNNPGGGYGVPNNGQGGYYTGANVLTQTEFDNLKQAIQRESFSDDKLRVARIAAQNKRMTVSQIKDIARLFTFSQPMLEFTKVAYANCADKQNYYEVLQVFTFSSDKKELENFINSH